MKQKLLLLFLGLFLACNWQANAQNCDPWIVKIYQQNFNRAPSAEECNIKNYNNGSWGSYDELARYIKNFQANKNASLTSSNCDPWIVKIYEQNFGRKPTAEECNIKNYNNGSWGSYEELTSLVKNYKNRTSNNAVATTNSNCDPWITQIYKEKFNRSPTPDECNIKNYNNGSWSTYNELAAYVVNFNNNKGGVSSGSPAPEVKPSTLTGDPWIFKAYREVYRKQPNAWELNKNNYNNGKWSSYSELRKYIVEYQNSIKNQRVSVETADLGNNNILTAIYVNGKQEGVNLVSADGGNVISAGGASILSKLGNNVVSAEGNKVVSGGGGNVVSAGGNNVVSSGGGNVVSAGGANVVSSGGGNLAAPRSYVMSSNSVNVISSRGVNILVDTNMAGVTFNNGYKVSSSGGTVIQLSGSSSLIIK